MTEEFFSVVNDAFDVLTPEELIDVDIVLGAYRTFRGNRRKHIAYVSMPITTGRRLIDAMTATGAKTQQELIGVIKPQGLYEQIIKPNIDAGIALADRLGLEKDRLFIAPSVFEAKRHRWSQDAYMSLWYRVIAEMAGEHYLMDGWEYSTGGIKEILLTLTMQWLAIDDKFAAVAEHVHGIKNLKLGQNDQQFETELRAMSLISLLSERGEEVGIDTVLDMVVTAAEDLRERGLDETELLGLAANVKSIPQFAPLHLPPAMDRHVQAWQGDRFRQAASRLDALLVAKYQA